MSKFAIEVNGLSKSYNKGGVPSLRSQLSQRLFRRESTVSDRHVSGQFLALDDISFNVSQGETVGIVGRNGAGKSTLLKILSRITRPTAGEIKLHGRLNALLEVGTGFHPELSGRENIMLNSSILGLSRRQVTDRFDAIVDFSEVGEFIDMPVKHYSSGMYMRLAFSVSAHLDPDILVLDEVLAVGDGAFQKKCLGRIDAVVNDGRTVLLVSHSLPMVAAFCNRAILIDKGRIEKDGKANEVINYYQETLTERSNKDFEVLHAEKNMTGAARFIRIKITPLERCGVATEVFRVGNDLQVEIELIADHRISDANVAIIVSSLTGDRLIDANLAIKDDYLSLQPGQSAIIIFVLRNLLLKPDTYRVGLWIGKKNVEDININVNAATFSVEIDPFKIQNFQTFPGIYQCHFTHTIEKS